MEHRRPRGRVVRIAQARIRHRAHALLKTWAPSRLRLVGLGTAAVWLARLTLAVVCGGCATIIVAGLGLGLPGPAVDLPGGLLGRPSPVSVPVVLYIGGCLGFAIAAGAIARAAFSPGRRFSGLAVAALAFVGLSLGALLLGAADELSAFERLLDPTSSLGVSASTLIRVTAAVALGASILLALTALAPSRLSATSRALLAAAPYLALLAGFGLTSPESFAVPTGVDPSLPSVLTGSAYLVPPLLIAASVAGLCGLPLALWQAILWARATRAQAVGLANRIDERLPVVVGGFLVTKLAWLAAGYSTLLPAFLGGSAGIWSQTANEPPIAWALAAAFAVGGLAVLVWGRRRQISERGFTPAALLVIAGFALPTVAGSLAVLALPLVQLLPGSPSAAATLAEQCRAPLTAQGPALLATCAITTVIEDNLAISLLLQLATIVVAASAAAVLVRRRRRRALALFLAATVVWALPHVPDVVRTLLNSSDRARSIAPDYASVDAVLTAGLAVLLLLWVSGRRTALGPRAIFLILVVSTLLADGGALVPPVWSRALFYLALVFPLTYELAFDASALNRPGADRAGRLIEGLGARAGAITVVAIGVALGTVTPDSQGTGTVGRVLFAVPFTALLLAATMARAAFREEAPPSQRTRRVVAAPAIAAVVLAAAAMTAVVATAAGQPVGPRPTAAPSPTLIPPSTSPVATTTATSFAEFHSHATAALRVMHDGVNAAQASIRAEDVAAVATEGAAAATFGGTELAWLDDHPAAGCFAGPWGDWRDVIVRYRAFGGAISSLAASVNGPTTGSAAPSADPLQAVVAASQEWASAVSVFGSAETMAASACGIGSPSP